jgi:hypothetical protein
MRLCGMFSLIVGGLLCASIVWAALGFLMMSVGLIALLIAEKRSQRGKVLVVRSAVTDQRREGGLLPSGPSTDTSQQYFPRAGEGDAAQPEAASIWPEERPSSRRANSETCGYDPGVWRSVVTADPDVAHSVEALAPFGEKYVDQLATAYLALGDKSYLSTLMEMVATTIQNDFGLAPLGVAAKHDFAMPKPVPVDLPPAGMVARSVGIGQAKSEAGSSPDFDEARDLADLLKKIS